MTARDPEGKSGDRAELDEGVASRAFEELARARPQPHPRVLEAIRADATSGGSAPSSRALSRNGRLALSGVLLFGGLSLTSLGRMLDHGAPLVAASAFVSLALGGWLLSGFVPGPRARLELRARRWIIGAAIAAVLAGYASFADHFADVDELLSLDARVHAGGCLVRSVLTGALGATGLLLVWRRTDPFTPAWTGALLGLLGGLFGATAASVSCDSTEGFHLLLGHGLVTLVLTMLFAALGRKWLTP